MSALTTLTKSFSERLGLGSNEQELIQTLKTTAFRGQVSDAQMIALLVIAQQYNLNPWLKEIYAYPSQNGIVPIVGVDGWSRIINENPNFDGIDFEQDEESCTCAIYRKDRTHPTKVTEWMSECRRSGKGPWETHPKRMLRHKALIQCARLAFGFVGIYDQDEAERMVESEKDITPKQEVLEKPELTLDLLNSMPQKFKIAIQNGNKKADDFIDYLSNSHAISETIKETIKSWESIDNWSENESN